MSLVTRQLDTLYNGVSQQPATLRLPSQHEVQVNAYGTVVDGVRKRPPFQHLARITTDDLAGAFVHTIDRDVSEQYVVIITSGKIQVYDTAGAAKTVNVTERQLEQHNQAVAVGDGVSHVIYAQDSSLDVVVAGITTATVLLEESTTGAWGGEETTIDTITADGTHTSAVTNGRYYRARISAWTAGTIDVDFRWPDTAYLLSAAPSSGFAMVSVADYSFVINKNITVAIRQADATQPYEWNDRFSPGTWDYDNVTEADVFWNPSASAAIDQADKQTFTDLPASPSVNDRHKITGQSGGDFGSYYVIRGNGVWNEFHGPNADTTYDEWTMPHALVREADGTFSFTTFKWKSRQVGDPDTNPYATFVGKTLNDVFYYKNRLGFVSDENVVFSVVNDFGNFWRQTVTDLLDSDVVDVAVSSQKVSLLKYAVPFNNSLMLFSDHTQFTLNIDQLLTPTSVSIDVATEYEAVPNVRPVGIGADVYFVTESGSNSRIREYFVRDDANSTDAQDISAHVPRYIPSGLTKLAGNANSDVLFAISNETDEDHRIYVYKFYWNGDQKAQSSWSYWEMDDNDILLSIDVIGQDLFALIKRADGTYLETLDLEANAVTGALTFDILLDRRATMPAGSFDSTDTIYDLDYPLATAQEKAALRIIQTNGANAGVLIDPTTYTFTDSDTVKIPGDTTTDTFVYGLMYEKRLTFSRQYPLNGDKAITTGRLMLRTFVVTYTGTAYFKTEVDPYGSGFNQVEEIIPSQLTSFTGKTIGDASLLVDQPNFVDGQYAFQIHGDSSVALISLVNDSHLQSKFQQVEWEAFYYNRARTL